MMKKTFVIMLLSVCLLSSLPSCSRGAQGAADTTGSVTDLHLNQDTEQSEQSRNPDSCRFGMTQDAFDSSFSELLEGIFTGRTEEVLTGKTVGESFAFHFPDVVFYDGKYLAYYICYRTPSRKGGVGLAVSDDAFTWEDRGCVITPDSDYDCNGAYFAGVWLDTDGTFYLAYECKGGEETEYGTLENIALAVSSDGVNWDKKGVILYKNARLGWQKANVGTPDLFKSNGVWYLSFHGFDYTDCQIGLASGGDLFHLTVAEKPIIPTKSGTRWSGTTGRRDVIFCGGYYYMVYEISTDQAPNVYFAGAKWTHMFARSRDMINWEISDGPQLVRGSDGEETAGFGYDGPCWIVSGGKLYVFMRDGVSTLVAELRAKG